MKSIDDPRVRYVRLGQNLKLPRALNVGFALSRGDYLTWTSDDNQYEPEAIGCMVGFLRGAPDCDFVYCDYWIDHDDGTTSLRRVDEPKELWERCRVGACFLYTRRVYECTGDYDPNLFLVEDYDYWLRVHRHFRMVPLHRPLYRFLYHSSSLTALHSAAWFERELAVRRKNRQAWPRCRRLIANLLDLPWDAAGFARGARDAIASGELWLGRWWLLRAALSYVAMRPPQVSSAVWLTGQLLDTLVPEPVMRSARCLKRGVAWLANSLSAPASGAADGERRPRAG